MRLTESAEESPAAARYVDSHLALGIGPSRHAALFVIQYLANQEGPVTIAELSRITGMHRATLYRTLESLESEGWITAEGQPKRFSLTLRLAQLGLRNLRHNHVREALIPFATEMCLELQTPTNVGFYEDGHVVMTDSIALVNGIAVSFPEGVRIPASCQGSGKVLLALQAQPEIDRILARPAQRYTPRTKTDPAEVLADLNLARERGYGWAFGEYGTRLCTVGFAIRNRSGAAIGAIGFVLGRQYEDGPPEDKVSIARDIVHRASAQFGFRPAFLDH